MKYIKIGILSLLLLCFFCFSSFNQTPAAKTVGAEKDANGIDFTESSWAEVVKKAKSEEKLIFVDAYATWCGPCRVLKKTTFKDKRAAAFFNENFINVAINMEEGEGPELANLWSLQVFPTLYVFDSDGKMVLVSEGFVNARDLITFGKEAMVKKSKKP
jgi:thioredoxin 1